MVWRASGVRLRSICIQPFPLAVVGNCLSKCSPISLIRFCRKTCGTSANFWDHCNSSKNSFTYLLVSADSVLSGRLLTMLVGVAKSLFAGFHEPHRSKCRRWRYSYFKSNPRARLERMLAKVIGPALLILATSRKPSGRIQQSVCFSGCARMRG